MAMLDFALAVAEPSKKFSAAFNLDLEGLENAFGPHEIVGQASGNLVFSADEDGVLNLSGYVKVPFRFVCDRCGGTFQKNVFENIAENVYPVGSRGDEDAELCYSRPVLDLDKLIKNILVASFPSKVLCREDCKGLCPKCGCNLNDGACNCDN